MINILRCLLLSFLLYSCGEDVSSSNQEPEDSSEQVLLLKNRSSNGVVQLSYTFNMDSTLSETISYDNEGLPNFRMTFDYLGDNITSEVISIETGQVVGSRKYYKQNETEGLREFYGSDGELSTVSTYLYDGNICGFTDIIAFDALGNSLPNTRIEFTDANCSSLFYSKYQDDDEYLQWEYTRNDKFDSSNSTILPFFRVEKQRCVTQLIRRTSDGTISTNLSYDAVFEYNEYDHPIKETRTYLDGDVVEYEYTYY